MEGRWTVSKQQGIGSIILERYGRLNKEIYEVLREHNPQVSDWNRLGPGMELVLPEVPASEDRLTDFYTVQVASFLSEEKTKGIAEDLCKSGIQNVFVITDRANPKTGERWRCSCVGVFSGVSESAEWLAEMGRKGFSDAYTARLRGPGLKDVLFPCPGP